MTNQEETNNNHKIYYSIGEVSQMLGVETTTLRYWEKEFDFFITPRKNKKGTRYYKQEDIEKIEMIIYLRNEKGLGIEGIRKKLKENPGETIKTYDIIAKLKNIKAEIKGIISELE